MLNFSCDYMEGAHPKILQRIADSNRTKQTGYGLDSYCDQAGKKIRDACGLESAAVHFLVGGTQANKIIITSLLKSYEGVIAAPSGHISVHEAGAIENSGHKVLTLPGVDGKLEAGAIQGYMEDFFRDDNHEHMVKPGLVYISHPTEYGTLYTQKELAAIQGVCSAYDLKLYLDGARLGYGLSAKDTDVTLQTLGKFCDVFYIGGTKVGALFGEAVVIPDPELIPHFFTIIKQAGALLAKGWLLGLQFDTLFTDDLYLNISRSAVELAIQIKQALLAKGYRLYIDSPTNQQFIIMENSRLEELKRSVVYSFWEKYDAEHTVIRLVTSWATTQDEVDQLIRLL